MSVRTSICVAVAVTCLALAGCSPATSTPANPGTANPGTANPGTANPGTRTVTATDADNGRTITLTVGERLTVRLDTTYWHFADLESDSVLSTVPQPAVTALSPGCLPGFGCGSVMAIYLAVAPGTVTVAADRTTCGEAMGCTGTNGVYRLHVLVR